MIELRKIKHVLAVAEHGSFAKAASALHITQSALTKSVQSAEALLGLRLLERNSWGVTLTVDGERFAERGARLLADAEAMSQDSKDARDLRTGLLRVGAAPEGFDWAWAQVLPGFARDFPGVSLQMATGSVESVKVLLLGGKIDLAIGALEALNGERDLVTEPVADYAVRVFVRRGHPLDHEKRPSADELFAFPLAGPTLAEPFSTLFRDLAVRAASQYEAAHYGVDSLALAKRLVSATDAFSMAIAPRATDADFEARFRSWPIWEFVPPMAISLAYRRDWMPTPAAAKLIEHCRKSVR